MTQQQAESMVKTMGQEWIAWICENLERGVPEQELIGILVKNAFDPQLSTDTVHQLSQKIKSGETNPVQIVKPAQAIKTEWQDYTNGPDLSCQNMIYYPTLEVDRPRIVVYENVLTPEECEALIAMSKPKLKKSTTVDNKTGDSVPHEHRTSSGTFFNVGENDFISTLDARISQVMQWPVENGEGMQILNYQIGGEYKPHYDYFPPEFTGSSVHISRGGQRVATLIMYLNTVKEGGETVFPEIKLKVKARQGSAVYFSYFSKQGEIDPLTLHGGTPVVHGEKWIATKWMRAGKFG